MWYGHETQIYPAYEQSPSGLSEDGNGSDVEVLHARLLLAHGQTLTFRAAETGQIQVDSVDGAGSVADGASVATNAVIAKNRQNIDGNTRQPFSRMLWHAAGLPFRQMSEPASIANVQLEESILPDATALGKGHLHSASLT